MQYYWLCISDTSITCPDFTAAANANGNTNPTPDLKLEEFDIITVGLKVCVAGSNECSPLPFEPISPGSWGYVVQQSSVYRIFQGAAVDLPIRR